MRPDGPRLLSNRVTAWPAACREVAQDRPLMPAPMMAIFLGEGMDELLVEILAIKNKVRTYGKKLKREGGIVH